MKTPSAIKEEDCSLRSYVDTEDQLRYTQSPHLEDAPMEQHYREHVVGYDTRYDHKFKERTGAAQVRFSDGVKVRIVAVPVPDQFKSKEEADEASIEAARNWIDNRTQSSSSSSGPVAPLSSKRKSAKSAAA